VVDVFECCDAQALAEGEGCGGSGIVQFLERITAAAVDRVLAPNRSRQVVEHVPGLLYLKNPVDDPRLAETKESLSAAYLQLGEVVAARREIEEALRTSAARQTAPPIARSERKRREVGIAGFFTVVLSLRDLRIAVPGLCCAEGETTSCGRRHGNRRVKSARNGRYPARLRTLAHC